MLYFPYCMQALFQFLGIIQIYYIFVDSGHFLVAFLLFSLISSIFSYISCIFSQICCIFSQVYRIFSQICCIFSQICCIFSQVCCIFSQICCTLFYFLILSCLNQVCYVFCGCWSSSIIYLITMLKLTWS